MINNLFKWFKSNLFPTPIQGVISIILFIILYFVLKPFINWAIIDAVWIAESADVCRQISDGACWAVISDKLTFIIFGFYPEEYRWRAWVVLGLYFGGIIYSGRKANWRMSLVLVWFFIIVFSILLLKGSYLGLENVESKQWGGLILTSVIALTSIIISYPLGIILALGKTNKRMPIIRAICSGFIEIIRGVPFISLLFMASLMLPLFLPSGFDLPKLPRTIVAGILFSGAYLAETIRGGLASVSRGQVEAADSVGLKYWHRIGLITLPQALTVVIQPTVGSFIALFIDTSLVVIISMYDLLGAARAALNDFDWLGLGREMYIFVALIYFAFCYTLSKYSRRLEKEIVTKKTN